MSNLFLWILLYADSHRVGKLGVLVIYCNVSKSRVFNSLTFFC